MTSTLDKGAELFEGKWESELWLSLLNQGMTSTLDKGAELFEGSESQSYGYGYGTKL